MKVERVVSSVEYGTAGDCITLDYDARHRRRIALTSDGGTAFLLDLPAAMHLRQGDGLLLENGTVIAVKASPEPLIEVRGRDQTHLSQLAWHLGNRHLPAQIEAHRILIRRDHVIAGMLLQRGALTREVVEPFDPEGGAYAHEH